MSDIPPEGPEVDRRRGGSPDDGSRLTPSRHRLASARTPSVETSQPPSSTTGAPSQRGAWSQRPPSRRSHLSAGHAGAPPPTGTPGSATSTSTGRPSSIISRPQSAASKTHVPSLTSHAFFRPMSSQRLQAQRAVRRSKTARAGSSDGSFSEVGSNINRQSLGPGAPSSPIATDMATPPPTRAWSAPAPFRASVTVPIPYRLAPRTLAPPSRHIPSLTTPTRSSRRRRR